MPGDRSAASPGGVHRRPRPDHPRLQGGRLRGHRRTARPRGAGGLKIQEVSGKKLVDFVARLEGNEEVAAIGKDSSALATRFPMPGFDVTQMKYNTL